MEKYKVSGFNPNSHDEEAEISVNGTDLVLYLSEMDYDFKLTGHPEEEEREFNLTSYKCTEWNTKTDEERERVLTPEEKKEIEAELVEFVDWCEWLSWQEPDPDFYRDDR